MAISGLLEEPLGVIGYPIRVVEIDGEPWFVAADVCRALGLNIASGTHNALRPLEPDERRALPTQPMRAPIVGAPTLISESGLYKLTMRSDKPQARQFQDWVTRVVLPTLRKEGAYVVGGEGLNLIKTPGGPQVAGQEKPNGLASFWAPSAH